MLSLSVQFEKPVVRVTLAFEGSEKPDGNVTVIVLLLLRLFAGLGLKETVQVVDACSTDDAGEKLTAVTEVAPAAEARLANSSPTKEAAMAANRAMTNRRVRRFTGPPPVFAARFPLLPEEP